MLDRLLRLLDNPPECEVQAVADSLELAIDAFKDKTGRTSVPKSAESLVIRIAIIYYNRRGNEGENSRTEGGISQSFSDDLPMDILKQLRNYPRKVGVILNETIEE